VGEDRERDTGMPGGDTQRVTIPEAARMLGVKEPAIRKRITRGTLRHERGDDGRTYVYLDAGIPTGIPTGEDARIRDLQDQVRYLREVVSTRDEEIRRRDVIISQLTQRIPELPPAAQEEPPQEPPEAPVTATEQPGRVGSQTPLAGAQEPVERRPWWRRMFGV
jgi:hypothetical protein